MADKGKSGGAATPPAGGKQAGAPPAGVHATPPPDPRLVWQVPALLLSLVLFVGAAASFFLHSPTPDNAGMLDKADRLIAREAYEEALEHLNHDVLKFVNAGGMPVEERRRFYILRARGFSMLGRVRGIDVAENHQTIVDDYSKAENAGAVLEPPDAYRLTLSYLALDKPDKALERVRRLPPEAGAQRRELLRKLVAMKFESPAPDPSSTLQLLEMFQAEPDLTLSDKSWAVARQAELLIRQGYADKAIAKLYVVMPRISDSDGPALGELNLLLGRAYLDTGATDDARRQLDRAAALLPEGDPRRGHALVLLARLDAQRGEAEEARQRYTAVIEQHQDDAVRLPALLGLGEAAAAAGDVEASLAHFGQLIEEMSLGRRHPEVTRDAVGASFMDRGADRAAAGDHASALRYAQLAERLHPPEAVPAPILLALARAHRRLAEDRLSGVGGDGPRLVELARLDASVREDARRDLVAGGAYFRRHADAVVERDYAAFGDSLWLAADSFDRAGDQDQAVAIFTEFVDSLRNDPRRDEARFRLAQAFQARGDYDVAASRYRELIDAGADGGGGPYSDAGFVPLARCLLANTEDTDDAEAKALLGAVVEGRVGGTDSDGYRDALVLLAGMHANEGAYAAAITRLEEALARSTAQTRSPAMLFDLADAHRRDASAITRTLTQDMPETERQALERTRRERLARAAELFTEVRDTLSQRDPDHLADADRLRLRNGCFYVADCAYDLRDFDGAIRLYDTARERYPRDPASLVAMIQIVNAYVEQGDLKRAATANERARRFYESLPESVWADPNLPIGRAQWQGWLDSLAVLGGTAADAGEGPPGGP